MPGPVDAGQPDAQLTELWRAVRGLSERLDGIDGGGGRGPAVAGQPDSQLAELWRAVRVLSERLDALDGGGGRGGPAGAAAAAGAPAAVPAAGAASKEKPDEKPEGEEHPEPALQDSLVQEPGTMGSDTSKNDDNASQSGGLDRGDMKDGGEDEGLKAKYRLKYRLRYRLKSREPPPLSKVGGAATPASGTASRWLSAAGAAVPSATGEQPGVAGQKRVINVLAKQSGVRGVWWCPRANGWMVEWCESRVKKTRRFIVHRHMAPGKVREEAEAEALRAAVAFREELEQQGKIKAARAEKTSSIKGVRWDARAKAWMATIKVRGKLLYGGYFRPKDDTPAEIERAWLAAIECRRRLELEHFIINLREAPDPSQVELAAKRARGSDRP